MWSNSQYRVGRGCTCWAGYVEMYVNTMACGSLD